MNFFEENRSYSKFCTFVLQTGTIVDGPRAVVDPIVSENNYNTHVLNVKIHEKATKIFLELHLCQNLDKSRKKKNLHFKILYEQILLSRILSE